MKGIKEFLAGAGDDMLLLLRLMTATSIHVLSAAFLAFLLDVSIFAVFGIILFGGLAIEAIERLWLIWRLHR